MIDSIDDNDNKQQEMSTTASLLINSTFSISKNPDKLEYINQNNENKYTTHMEASDNIVTIRNNNNNYTPITQVKQLFVGNLPFRVRWQDLKDLFRKSGQVQRADVALTYDGRSKGHGTVLFQTVEDAQTAINMLHNFKWFGRILEVREDRGYIEQHSSISKSVVDQQQQQQSKNKNTEKHYIQMNRKTDTKNIIIKQDSIQPGRQLFVGNLPYYCQWQELKDLFRGAGNVLRADVAQDSDGKKNLGYGIVLFAVLEDAKRAIAMYDGYKYQGRQLRVRFDKYSPFISYNQQDQYNLQHTQHSKRYTSETNNNMNHNYITDKDALECLQQTYGKSNNEHYNTHSMPDHFYPIQPGLHYPSIEKDINNNNNTINNNNLFDNDIFTDTNSTILSSPLTTQFNYEQQQQQQQQQLSGILYQQEQCTNPSNMNHQYINKSPKNPCLMSNYMVPNPPTTSTTIAATGLTSPPLYMYHENSPPIEPALSFQLSPSSIDSIEKNTPSTSTSHFHHLYSTGPHFPLLTGPYDLNAFQPQQGDKMNKNKCGYNNNNNNKEIKSIDQQLFNNDDEIHLMNVINTIGLNDDSAGLNSDFILSSFIGNMVDDEDDEDDYEDDDLCNKGIMKDKFLKSEISTLWDQ
ncbi:hypothetical protein BJ944DRAFT_246004 [Cunninghamella echinulata]|nr:hypothetical protein BJ944DRAFT_246004 [Cunninghamella echinulata]